MWCMMASLSNGEGDKVGWIQNCATFRCGLEMVKPKKKTKNTLENVLRSLGGFFWLLFFFIIKPTHVFSQFVEPKNAFLLAFGVLVFILFLDKTFFWLINWIPFSFTLLRLLLLWECIFEYLWIYESFEAYRKAKERQKNRVICFERFHGKMHKNRCSGLILQCCYQSSFPSLLKLKLTCIKVSQQRLFLSAVTNLFFFFGGVQYFQPCWQHASAC